MGITVAFTLHICYSYGLFIDYNHHHLRDTTHLQSFDYVIPFIWVFTHRYIVTIYIR